MIGFLLVALVALAPLAGADEEEFVAGELVVRLAPSPDGPSPEAVVEAARDRRALPGGLGIGGPAEVRFAIERRATGGARERLLADPDSPRARLERYLVLRYPPVVDLDAIESALEHNPKLEVVHRNRLAGLSVVPNDPLMIVTSSPDTHQWGPYELSLPAAWDYTKGHAYLGIVDTGLDVDHEEHVGLYHDGSAWVWAGGNYRPHLSYDYGHEDSNVDEGQTQGGITPSFGGHGTHVAGIAAASTDNSKGIAGNCWNCSLMIGKVTRLTSSGGISVTEADVAQAITGMVDNGAQVINLSLGYRPNQIADCTSPNVVCDAVDHADDRDVVISAAAGNDGSNVADWPATDPRAIGVGGIEFGGAFWDDCPGIECGSNSDPDQLVTPAKEVLSTFYPGLTWNPSLGCDESLHPLAGYGPCTGTSMSAPYLTGSVGLLRSVNPLLEKEELRGLLIANVENPPGWNPANGIGKPNVRDAVEDALGRSGGQVLDNRLTPLFRLYSPPAEDTFHTTVPQWGAAGYWGPLDGYYVNAGVGVPGYPHFPDTQCRISPCSPPPGADVFILSGDRSPNGHPLVPLYRLSFVGATPSNPDNRDHVYTTEEAGLKAYAGVGYRLDGVEGYIYQRCTPEPGCMPAGTVRLYRLYNAALDDHAIFPESLLTYYSGQGYGSTPGANDWIGYVYPNEDADSDGLIDGFELLAGTGVNVADSDCDGTSDGDELWLFPYSDPLDGGCEQVIGEVGRLSNLNDPGRTVTLSRTYQNPVVFAQPLSFNGSQPAIVRITSVGSNSFTLRVEEPSNEDGNHTLEQVTWMVFEAGSWQLADGTQLEIGRFDTNATVGVNVAGGALTSVGFSQPFGSAPIVVSQVQTANDPAFVGTRQKTATTTGFQIALEGEEAATAYHGTETVGWLAIEPRIGNWSGRSFESVLTSDIYPSGWRFFGWVGSYSTAPYFLAAVASYDGTDSCHLRYRNLGAAGVDFYVQEDTTFDAEIGHTTERLSVLAVEGSGQLTAAPR